MRQRGRSAPRVCHGHLSASSPKISHMSVSEPCRPHTCPVACGLSHQDQMSLRARGTSCAHGQRWTQPTREPGSRSSHIELITLRWNGCISRFALFPFGLVCDAFLEKHQRMPGAPLIITVSAILSSSLLIGEVWAPQGDCTHKGRSRMYGVHLPFSR